MIKLSAFADEAADELVRQISALKQCKINYLELRSVNKKNVAEFSAAESKEYFARLSGENIKVWAIGSPLGKTDISVDLSKFLSDVKRVCETACLFNCDKVRVFSFFNAYAQENKVTDYLNLATEETEKFGVTLYHENEKEIFGDILQRVLTLKNNVKNLKLVFDPANFAQSGENPLTALKTLRGDISYYHIKDVVKSTGEIAPAGYGDCGIDELINGLNKSAETVLTLEPHLHVFSAFNQIDSTRLKNKFEYNSCEEAFFAGADALKKLIEKSGYAYDDKFGGYIYAN